MQIQEKRKGTINGFINKDIIDFIHPISLQYIFSLESNGSIKRFLSVRWAQTLMLAHGKKEQISAFCLQPLHLQIWNIEKNKKYNILWLLCKYDISPAGSTEPGSLLTADTRMC